MSYSQQGWIPQSSGVNDTLRSVKFINSSTGFIVGTRGRILKTTNAGMDWFTLQSNTSHELFSVCFPNSSLGFACGDIGLIIKTTNAGNNWVTLKTISGKKLRSITFINENNVWCAGDSGLILSTTNGGINWSSQHLLVPVQLNGIHFANERKGWVAGLGGLLHTTDSGANWYYQYNDGALLLNSIFFIDSIYGWSGYYDNITFGPEIITTTDGGTSWRNYSTMNRYSISFFFTSRNNGWSSGYYGNIIKTTNGGINWTPQLTETIDHLFSIFFKDSLTGWAVGENGTVLKTTSGGMITNISNVNTESPSGFFLEQNYPNPFNPKTVISYQLKVCSFASLKVYGVLGKEVITLIDQKQNAGIYNYELSIRRGGSIYQLSSGIYYYSLYVDGSLVDTKRMVLLK